ncbi:AAA family ATPase [Mesorhizobium yinganensis]|uniref:AAA family ATPase n=1 Tax=Mesorhizobium yinganensis TaxID=3157707 RepID=UPI0032B79071
MRSRLGEPDDLPTAEKALRLFEGIPVPEQSTKAPPLDPEFEESRIRLVEEQRRERDALMAAQEQRTAAENRARQARLPTGLKAVWFRLNGRYGRLVDELARDAAACAIRDRNERQALVQRHIEARRNLERRRTVDLTKSLDAIFLAATQPDLRQQFVMPKEALAFTQAELERKPSLILAHLSHKQARFSDTDVKRALATFIDNPLVLRIAIDKALAAPELVRLDAGDCTTQDYQDAGHKLEAAVSALTASGGFAVARRHVDQAVQEQDSRMQERFGGCLSNEQKAALSHILGDRGFCCVVGLAGSGKSTMLDTARQAWARQGVRVNGAALSGKAAEGMQNASGIESRTLASLETSWKNGYEPIARGDVLVVDEAGMVGTRQLMRVAEKLRQVGAKLVLVGDPGQLQPIEAGTPFRGLIERHGATRLNEIHRQKAPWQRHASRDLAEGRLREALGAYDADGSVRHCAKRETALAALLEQYLGDRAVDGPAVTRLAFAHRRKDVFALNQAIRQALRASGEPTPETIVATETGPRAFARGDRIVFTRNDKDVGMKNGMLGTVETVDEGHLSVLLDSEDGTPRRVTFNPESYRSFDHGYAVTIHKSQGATVDRAYVLFSRTMDAPLTYVAMTRHRDAMRLYINGEDRPAWVEPDVGSHPWQRPVRARTFDWS